MSAELLKSIKCADWVLNLVALPKHGIVASTTNGYLQLIPFDPTVEATKKFKAHSQSINKLRIVDDNIIATCSNDATVKLWDLRNIEKPLATLTNTRNLPFLSLDSRHGLIAAGTELSGTDSELILWDLADLEHPLRSFIDSHNDDITDIKFHPTRKNLLLSGSTDGYVNLYDLNIKDEEDALLQVINFTSIHSTNFLNDNRIFTLSHMETFAIHEVANLQIEEMVEPKPKELGDIRESWACEYVVDLYSPGYVCCGSNSKSELKLFEFDPVSETFNTEKQLIFPGGHGEEVVRDFIVYNGLVYTGGEDSYVKIWKAGEPLANTRAEFFGGVVEPVDEEMDGENKNHKSHKRDKKDKKKHKVKHSKKKDKEKKDKKRFRPY